MTTDHTAHPTEPSEPTASSLEHVLGGWIVNQRWYTAKSATASPVTLDEVAHYALPTADADVDIHVAFVRDAQTSDGTTYQVPLTLRTAAEPQLRHALIGVLNEPGRPARWVYDAPHDPAYARSLWDVVRTGGEGAVAATAAPAGPGSVPVQGVATAALTSYDADVATSRVLTGEQSNTSIIMTLTNQRGIIVKVFRVLNLGPNPDIELTGALTRAGNHHVPTLLGHLSGRFSADTRADLAFAQEFFRDVRDAWREALDAARADRDFTAAARSLGASTASVHRMLAHQLGVTDASAQRVQDVLASMRDRARAATAAATDLSVEWDAIMARYAAVEHLTWPAFQRIHGDYHLGQVLDIPDRGWVLLDFEGEPLRPLAERSLPDSPIRDIAGMLRSFDYAAGTVEMEQPQLSRREWARASSDAFLAGYEAASELRIDPDLLAAFVLDKALYEVVYEARNRPSWLPIPRNAITRLVTSPAPDRDELPQPAQEAPMNPSAHPASADEVTTQELAAVVRGEHRDPHRVLGAHVADGTITFRTIRPLAETVTVLMGTQRVPLRHVVDGVWAGSIDGDEMPDYRIEATYPGGHEHRADDPYRFWPTLGELDLHLIGEGRHEQLWKVLGAQVRTYPSVLGEVRGTAFTVWAPNARAVRVVGDFNSWDGVGHPMRALGESGVWELFVPDVHPDCAYQFDILCSDGVRRRKADPMARQAQTAPATASTVTESTYEWQDAAWMERRAKTDPHTSAMSTYEVHLGSWRADHSYRDLAEHLVNYVKDLGFTHVEFMPVMEHPYPPSWGYHVTSYYAPNSRFGDPDDFKYLVDRLHQAGIGVILDWVPGHFATDEWALARFDGSPLYEHPDPRRGWHPEWGSNIFDFGRPQVRNFLVANALYWLEEFHADGLRVDGVASMLYLDYARGDGEWEPNEYGGRENLEAVRLLQETNATAYRRTPGTVIIAEESTSWPGVTRPTDSGGLGFGLKWNMGWMHDSLSYFARQPVHRPYHHNDLTFALTYAFSENFVLPISHDEVVHGKGSLVRKMPGDRWQQLANVRTFLAFMWAHPGKQLLFMGCEFAQEAEWADGRQLDWWLLDQPAHSGIHALVKDLNRTYTSHPALWSLDHSPEGFQWLNADDSARSAYTWLRYGAPVTSAEGDTERPVMAVVVNTSDVPQYDVRIGLPRGGEWVEILNTDASVYGGSGVGNLGAVQAENKGANGQPYSASVTLPPLGAVWFEPAEQVRAAR